MEKSIVVFLHFTLTATATCLILPHSCVTYVFVRNILASVTKLSYPPVLIPERKILYPIILTHQQQINAPLFKKIIRKQWKPSHSSFKQLFCLETPLLAQGKEIALVVHMVCFCKHFLRETFCLFIFQCMNR